jgi:hypothetical protein
MKLFICKNFSKNLVRSFNHLQGFKLAYIKSGPFRDIPSICNQRSLTKPKKILTNFRRAQWRLHFWFSFLGRFTQISNNALGHDGATPTLSNAPTTASTYPWWYPTAPWSIFWWSRRRPRGYRRRTPTLWCWRLWTTTANAELSTVILGYLFFVPSVFKSCSLLCSAV